MNKTAVIEIMKPLVYFDEKYRYQDVPLHALENRMVDVKKGASGHKMISTKNIKLLKVFDSDDKKGIKNYINSLRNKNINENLNMKKLISEGLEYHLNNKIPISDSIYRPGSDAHIKLLSETRELYDNGLIKLSGDDEELFETTDIGRFGKFRGELVPLDVFLIEYYDEVEDVIEEGKKKKKTKKHPPLGKIRRNSGSGKKYVVYVKNPSTGKIKKITFGDKKGGLRSKTGSSKARKNFAARHNCAKKKDRMTAGYWACRLNRSGLVKRSTSGYW